MPNTLVKTSRKTLKTTGKAVKKSAQYKAAQKAVKTVAKRTSTRTRAAFFLGVGATTAAGAYLIKRGGKDGQKGDADLNDPAVAAGV